MADDALELIHLRNEFYRKKFHLVLAAFFLALIGICILVSIIVYLMNHRAHPIYFAADDVGRIIQDVPLTQPNMTVPQAQAWVKEAVETTYTYNFVSYRKQFQNAQKYFTDGGWQGYMQALTASNSLLALTKRQYIVTAQVIGDPKVVATGFIGGRFSWRFEMPVLVNYLQRPVQGIPSSFQNPLKVTVTVQRRPILESYKGLGIIQFVGVLVTNNQPAISG